MKREKLTEKIENAFSSRAKPAQVRLGQEILQHDPDMKFLKHDPDVEDALWFSGRDWHELTWKDWQEHSSAISFFDNESFAYYLPSVLVLSAQNPNDWLQAAESLIYDLDRTPDPEGWTEGFERRFLGLNPTELGVLKEWLLQLCEYNSYAGRGISASGPGDRFGRAFDTLDLLRKEIERRRAGAV